MICLASSFQVLRVTCFLKLITSPSYTPLRDLVTSMVAKF